MRLIFRNLFPFGVPFPVRLLLIYYNTVAPSRTRPFNRFPLLALSRLILSCHELPHLHFPPVRWARFLAYPTQYPDYRGCSPPTTTALLLSGQFQYGPPRSGIHSMVSQVSRCPVPTSAPYPLVSLSHINAPPSPFSSRCHPGKSPIDKPERVSPALLRSSSRVSLAWPLYCRGFPPRGRRVARTQIEPTRTPAST